MKPFTNLFSASLLLAINQVFSYTGCISDNKTYVVNVKAHVESLIQNSLISLSAKLAGTDLENEYISVNGETAKVAATRSYLGTIFEELNEDLFQYKVQVNLVLDPQEIDQIDHIGKVDPSCELGNALKSRTQVAFDMLSQKYDKSVGNHLYIVGCPISQDAYSSVEVLEKNTCGRVFGIMWTGSNSTKNSIKSAILQALTGTPNMYATGSLNMSDKNSLCRYCENCISSTESALGILLDYLTKVTFTKA